MTIHQHLKKDWEKPGIYVLFCTYSERLYVGKSVHLYKRIGEHRAKLRRGEHANIYLQRSWDKYGEDAFGWAVLEWCAEEDLPLREAFWMSYLSSTSNDKGFNISLETASGTRLSQETKDKLRLQNLGKVYGPESRAKQSAASLGKKKSKEHCENISKGRMGLKSTVPVWNKGLKYKLSLSTEQRQTIRDRLNKHRKDQSKPLLMYKGDEFVGEFINYKAVQEQYPDFTQSGISRSARGIYPIYKGYSFRFKS